MSNEEKVIHFFRKPRPNVNMKILHRVFLKEEFDENDEKSLSYRQFCRIMKKSTCTRTIRTGGAEIDLKKLANVIAKRAYLGVNIYNTIAIDEKPVVIKNYLIRSCRVLKSHKGPLFKSMLYGLKMNPFYIIAAIDCNGLVTYQISDEPVHIEQFESFIVHVARVRSKETQQFLLYDNASFHNVSDECINIINDYNFLITKTPPSGCFTDPIEEFFAIFDSIFKKEYQDKIVESGYYNPLTRSQIRDLINNALKSADRSLIKQYRRALIY